MRARMSAVGVTCVVLLALPFVVSELPHPAARDGRRALHRDSRARHHHGRERPALARARGVHGGRRLHDRDPRREPRYAGRLDDRRRGRRRRGRRADRGTPGAAIARASTSRSRRSGSRVALPDDPDEVRPFHRRLDRDLVLRQSARDRPRRRCRGARCPAEQRPVALCAHVGDRASRCSCSPGGCSTRGSAGRCAPCETASSPPPRA